MATKLEQLRWELFNKKEDFFMKFAIKRGLMGGFNDAFLDKMSQYYYHGIPSSLMLLSPDLTICRCLEMGPFLTLGFEDDVDFRIVYATTNSIKLNHLNIDMTRKTNYEDHGLHCFVEVITDNGVIYVYDPTKTLVYVKEIYYAIENPKIISTLDKSEIIKMSEYDDLKNASSEIDEYAKENLLPIIDDTENITTNYKERLLKETALLKKRISETKILSKKCKE